VTDPLVHELTLRCSAADAFATYTQRIGEWWDARYTANPETLRNVTLEPRAGGRVFATHADLGDHSWGEVTVWEPPHRLVHTFGLAQRSPSEVAIEFSDVDGESRVHFEHRGWTDANAADRVKFGDWPLLLNRFAALAAS
jgi:uncharacterized protein YndB with AHSA1/START domain